MSTTPTPDSGASSGADRGDGSANSSSQSAPSRAPGGERFHARPSAEIVATLATSLTRGLDDSEVAARLLQVGPNKLAEGKRPTLFSRFIAQISDFTVLALLAAAAIAGTLGAIGPLEP